ncbi:hypothetical protein BJ508DRAFT_315584 [Ascobolus immersus RN42]|uniref:Uncharacterized protein n=1 Tax=Ascobolus immersus RN42 TaxID=1160509 RepID=A0A3N4HA41_ASCIM|nr:hypothetical protein BJ508DRAFT_315584 [Ascobolus immersus RN42]
MMTQARKRLCSDHEQPQESVLLHSPPSEVGFGRLPHEVRLLMSESIVSWRDHMAFRQTDRTNYTLLTATYKTVVTNQFRMDNYMEKSVDSIMRRMRSGSGLVGFLVKESGYQVPTSQNSGEAEVSDSENDGAMVPDVIDNTESQESIDWLKFLHRNNVRDFLKRLFLARRIQRDIDTIQQDVRHGNRAAKFMCEGSLDDVDMTDDSEVRRQYVLTFMGRAFAEAVIILRLLDPEVITKMYSRGCSITLKFLARIANGTIAKSLSPGSDLSIDEARHLMEASESLTLEVKALRRALSAPRALPHGPGQKTQG